MHEFNKTILSCDRDLIFGEITILDYPIVLVVHVALLITGGRVFIQFMHLTDALDALEYDKPKGFQNFISECNSGDLGKWTCACST